MLFHLKRYWLRVWYKERKAHTQHLPKHTHWSCVLEWGKGEVRNEQKLSCVLFTQTHMYTSVSIFMLTWWIRMRMHWHTRVPVAACLSPLWLTRRDEMKRNQPTTWRSAGNRHKNGMCCGSCGGEKNSLPWAFGCGKPVDQRNKSTEWIHRRGYDVSVMEHILGMELNASLGWWKGWWWQQIPSTVCWLKRIIKSVRAVREWEGEGGETGRSLWWCHSQDASHFFQHLKHSTHPVHPLDHFAAPHVKQSSWQPLSGFPARQGLLSPLIFHLVLERENREDIII